MEILFLKNNMNKNILGFIILVFTVLLFNSCKKTPGQGGNARIKGVFWERKYDLFFSIVQARYPSVNRTVYLFFGDDTSPGTTVNTNSKGEFEFQYLRKGKYKVVVYSRQNQTSSSTTPNVSPLEYFVDLTKRNQITDIGLDTINQ